MAVFFLIGCCFIDDDGLHGITQQPDKESDTGYQPVRVDDSEYDTGYTSHIEQQAGTCLEAQQIALDTFVVTCRSHIAYSFFFPVLVSLYGLHSHDGTGIGFHPGIFCIGYLIDEQGVFSPLQVQVRGISFLFEKKFFSVSEVSSQSHVRLSGKGKA